MPAQRQHPIRVRPQVVRGILVSCVAHLVRSSGVRIWLRGNPCLWKSESKLDSQSELVRVQLGLEIDNVEITFECRSLVVSQRPLIEAVLSIRPVSLV